MWRRLILAMLLAAVGVLAFLVALVRSPAGGRQLCEVAEATLREVSHERVVIGTCEVDPLGTRVVIDHVEIGAHEHPLLAAERLSARLDARQLLEGKVKVDGVEIIRPRIDADLSHPPADDEVHAQRPRGAACLPDLGHLEVGTITLTDGALELALPGGRRLSTEGLGLKLLGHGEAVALNASANQATLTDATGEEVVERALVRGEIDFAAGTARVDAMDVSMREGALFAQATLSNVCALRGTVTASVRLDLEKAGKHLLASVPHLKGAAAIRLTAGLDGARYDANIALEARGTEAWMLTPGDFDAQLSATPERLTIRSLEWPLPSGKVHATGSIELSAPYILKLETQYDHLVMGEVLTRVGVPDLTTHLEASGTASVRGPLTGPGGMRLDGVLDAKVPVFAVYDRPWYERAKPHRQWVGLEHGTIDGRFVLGLDRLELKAAHVTAGDTVGDAQGMIWYDAHRGMDVEYDFPALSLGDLGPYGAAEIRGKGSASGSVRGPYRALDIRATCGFSGLVVANAEMGRASAHGRLDTGALTLDVDEAHGQIGRSTWDGTVFMDFTRHSETTGRVNLHNAHVADLAATARHWAPSLATWDGKLDAILDGPVDLSGPAADLDAVGEVSVRDALLYGQKFPTGRMHASMIHADTWTIDRLHLDRGEGHLEASGEYRLEDDGYEFQLHTAKLHVSDLDPLLGASPDLTGTVTFRAEGSGTLSDRHARAHLVLRDFFKGPQPLGTVRMDAEFDGTDASFSGTATSPWAKGTRPHHEPGTPFATPPGSMLNDFTGTVSLAGDLPFHLSANLFVPELAKTLAPDALNGITGGLSGRLTAEGLAAKPLSITADLVLDKLWVKQGELKVENSGPAEMRYAEGRLSLESLPLVGPNFELSAIGTREADGRLDLGAEGSADLSILSRWVPAIEDAQGHASFSMTVNGTLDNPLVVGNASVDGLSLKPRDLPMQLTDGHGTVVFSPKAVVTDGIEAQVNGARVSLGGHLDLDRFKPGAFELNLNLGDIPLVFDDIPVTIAGNPSLHGTLDQMTLSGDLEVTKFRFQKDLELERTIAQAVELALQRRPPPVPRVFERGGEFLTLDMGLHLGDVRVDDNLLKADLRGDLRLTGTNKHPGLLGAVTFNDAKAQMRNTEFDISSGVINFTDRNRIRPTFDVQADAQVREYLVHVAASGTAQAPRLLLSSEPPLADADIVTLLTLGVTSRDFDRAGSTSLAGALVDAAYNASGLNDQVKKLLPKSDLLKDASLRVTSAYSELSGNIEPVAQFEGKLHWDNLKLRGQTSLIGRGKKAQAEWKFSDSMSGVVQVDSDNPSVPTADYGADLKWHVERP